MDFSQGHEAHGIAVETRARLDSHEKACAERTEASQSWARVAWSLVGALGTGLLALAGLFARAKGWY